MENRQWHGFVFSQSMIDGIDMKMIQSDKLIKLADQKKDIYVPGAYQVGARSTFQDILQVDQ